MRRIIFEKIKKSLTKKDLVETFKKGAFECIEYDKMRSHEHEATLSIFVPDNDVFGGRRFYMSIINDGEINIHMSDSTRRCFSFPLTNIEYDSLREKFEQRKEMLFQEQYLKEREKDVNMFLNL